MNDASPGSLSHQALIVGAGYLGRRVATRLLERGCVVWVTTRQPGRAAELSAMGCRPALVEVTQPLTLTALRPAMQAESLDVYYLVPPGRGRREPTPRQVLVDGMEHAVQALAGGALRRAVMSSSTAVYGRQDGGRVDADSDPEPHQERGELLLHAENRWRAARFDARVVRLAGLYGPERIVGLQAVREGQPLLGDPQGILNLIHVDDAAELLLAVMAGEGAGEVELGSDDQPVPRIEYYGELARRLGVDPPRVMHEAQLASLGVPLDRERLRRSSSKTCDNGPTKRRTGWQPRYPSFYAGLDELLPDPAA